jgi:serine/threonine-protein kinase HipA
MNFTASDAEQLFRRMVFNVETRNNDDHTKNISFLMDRNGSWSLAPAYDLCYSYNPAGKWTAHHQMSLNGKQDDFTKDDLLSGAKNVGVRRANEIVDEITNVIREWNDIAKDCGVRDNHREQIAKQLLLF